MPKRKKDPAADILRVDLFRRSVSIRPLFGLERLVSIQRRKRSGVLFCDNVTTLSDTIIIASDDDSTPAPFTLRYETSSLGFMCEPRLSVANEAPEDDLNAFRESGTEYTFIFTPAVGLTYSAELDLYKPFDSRHGGFQFCSHGDMRVATVTAALDLSAYVEADCPVKTPMCQFDPAVINGQAGISAPATPRHLAATKASDGAWEWSLSGETVGTMRVAWELGPRDRSSALDSLDVDRFTAELSVDPSVAKDLHNFVSICQYYVADVRSLSAIGREMIASKTALCRSLDVIERLVGAAVIERTRGKGLIRITPVGEAVLEWWSRFYMRWMPISTARPELRSTN